LLAENELREYDPLKEAFAFFDAEGTGSVDPAVLRAMLEEMGAGPVSDEDMDILLQHADLDKDGRIGLHDFCHIVYGPQRGVDSHADFASKSRTTANVSGDAAPPAAAATQ
jgi:calmodulin